MMQAEQDELVVRELLTDRDIAAFKRAALEQILCKFNEMKADVERLTDMSKDELSYESIAKECDRYKRWLQEFLCYWDDGFTPGDYVQKVRNAVWPDKKAD